MDWLGFAVTVLTSSGIAVTVSVFALQTLVTHRVKFHFDRALLALKQRHSEELAALNARLVVEAGRTLEDVKALYQQKLNQELEMLRNRYALEQERIKAGLTTRIHDDVDMYKQRRDKYPALQEVIYRIRNLSRAIVHDPHASEAATLSNRITELENKLYQHALYLQRDEVFATVHSFKNDSLTFNMVFRDHRLAQGRDEDPLQEERLAHLRHLYDRIDAQHRTITQALAALISAARAESPAQGA